MITGSLTTSNTSVADASIVTVPEAKSLFNDASLAPTMAVVAYPRLRIWSVSRLAPRVSAAIATRSLIRRAARHSGTLMVMWPMDGGCPSDLQAL
jgi:hypothetical protein